MGPRGPLSLKERLKDARINSDTSRREKALNILRDEGYAEFALYVVSKNIPLHEPGPRGHSVYRKSYLLRDEPYNDCLFVKAILDKTISSAAIIQLYQDSLSFKRLSIIDYNSFHTYIDRKVIKIRSKESTEVGTFGPMGMRGPGDDGYGGSCCGDGPMMRQYLNDPICLLMALFIRGDRSLIDYMLEQEKSLSMQLYNTFELFLVDPEAYDELFLISHYMHLHIFSTFIYNSSFTKRAYPDRYAKGDFFFLERLDRGLAEDISNDKIFTVEAKYLDIMPCKQYYEY